MATLCADCCCNFVSVSAPGAVVPDGDCDSETCFTFSGSYKLCKTFEIRNINQRQAGEPNFFGKCHDFIAGHYASSRSALKPLVKYIGA